MHIRLTTPSTIAMLTPHVGECGMAGLQRDGGRVSAAGEAR
jgi:hypothetical protein